MAQHQIPFGTGEEERLIGPLSTSASLWLAGGAFTSYQMAKIVPTLPIPGIVGHLHYLIPLAISATMAFVRYKDMTLVQYIQLRRNFKRRKKRLIYERESRLSQYAQKD